MPAAQLSLRCAIDIYGRDVVELVPAYLLLAEASIGEPTHTSLILIPQSTILQLALLNVDSACFCLIPYVN